MEKYKQLIVRLLTVRDKMMEIDTKQMWEYHFPEIACNESEIERVQEYIGFKLDNEYVSFLLCANGWKCFYQMVDLFGTKDLVSDKMKIAEDYLQAELEYDEELCSIKDKLLPIACSQDDNDLFVLVLDGCTYSGSVIWLAGGQIDRFDSFYDFFESMIEYNRITYEYMLKNVYSE